MNKVINWLQWANQTHKFKREMKKAYRQIHVENDERYIDSVKEFRTVCSLHNYCCGTLFEEDAFGSGRSAIVSAKYECPDYSVHAGCKNIHCPRRNQNNVYFGLHQQYFVARDLRKQAFRNIFTKSK